MGILDAYASHEALIRNAAGIITPEEMSFIPAAEWPKAVLATRIHMAIYAATLISAWAIRSLLPLMLFGLPRLYGCWHMFMNGFLQHGALAEDVVDHRLNSRSVYMNPVSRWIYWNISYHVEHHTLPRVPYHALPRLHALIKDEIPAANPSFAHACSEVIRALWRQRTEPDHYIRRVLPPTARPYREAFHTTSVERD